MASQDQLRLRMLMEEEAEREKHPEPVEFSGSEGSVIAAPPRPKKHDDLTTMEVDDSPTFSKEAIPRHLATLGEIVPDALRGGANGITLGFAGEAVGALGALAPPKGAPLTLQQLEEKAKLDPANKDLTVDQRVAKAHDEYVKHKNDPQPKLPSYVERYRTERDAYDKDDDAAQARSPWAYGLGQVGGSLLAPIPGVSGAGALRTIGQGAAVGTAGALGNSRADLTKGEFKDAAKDMAVGGLVAGGLGAATVGARAAVGKFGGVASRAKADAAAKSVTSIDEGIASDLGSFGSTASKAAQTLELAERAAASGQGKVKQDAIEWLASPEAQALRERAFRNRLKLVPQQMDDMAKAEQKYVASSTSRSADIAKKEAELLGNPLRAPLNYAKKYAPRAIIPALSTAVGAGIGHALGMPGMGGLVGSGIGTLASAAVGDPGRALTNVVNNTALRNFIGTAGGEFSGFLAKALEKSPQAFVAAHQFLKTKFPDKYPGFAGDQVIEEAVKAQ